MKTIDKIRQYVRSISSTDEDYNRRLLEIYVDPNMRNRECKHPEFQSCGDCPLNRCRRKSYT